MRFHHSELNNGSILENGNLSEACALVSSKVMAHVDLKVTYFSLEKHLSEIQVRLSQDSWDSVLKSVLHLGRKIVGRTCWANISHLSCNYAAKINLNSFSSV